jgi:hypothetical protein
MTEKKNRTPAKEEFSLNSITQKIKVGRCVHRFYLWTLKNLKKPKNNANEI